MTNDLVARLRHWRREDDVDVGHEAADAIEQLRDMLSKVVDSVEDTLRSHADELECCVCTQSRVKEARAYLTALDQTHGK